MSTILPEEILSLILSHALSPPTSQLDVLLVSRRWYRVSIPIIYHTIVLKKPKSISLLAQTLGESVHRSSGLLVRSLQINSEPSISSLISKCTNIAVLDLYLDTNLDAAPLISSLARLENLTHLTLRKSPSLYLTHPCLNQFFRGLADIVGKWRNLESVYIAFRVSGGVLTSPSVTQSVNITRAGERGKGIEALTQALALSPKLESVITHMPSVWNSVLGDLATNGEKKLSKEGNQGASCYQHSCSTRASSEDRRALKKLILLPGSGQFTPGHGLGLDACSFKSSFYNSPPMCSPPASKDVPAFGRSPNAPFSPYSNYMNTAEQHPKLMGLIQAGWGLEA